MKLIQVLVVFFLLIIISIVPIKTTEVYPETETYNEKEPYETLEHYTAQEPYTQLENYIEREPYVDTETFFENEPYTGTECTTKLESYTDQACTAADYVYTVQTIKCEKASLGPATYELRVNNLEKMAGTFTFYVGFIVSEYGQEKEIGKNETKLIQAESFEIFSHTLKEEIVTCNYKPISIPTKQSCQDIVRFRNVSDCQPAIQYRDVAKTREVIKYREVTKTRNVTLYQEVTKTRTVTSYKDVPRSRDVLKTRGQYKPIYRVLFEKIGLI